MKVYGFPGQGSQAPGMGGELFDQYPRLTEVADAVLGYSVKELCLHDPQGRMNDTRYAQPALFVVNALTYVDRVETKARRADYFIGHSLGELSALHAAGAFSFTQGLEIVAKRGELMNRVSGGAMAAIVNCSQERIEQVLVENGLRSVDIANYNAPDQIVISGLKEDLIRAESCFRSGKVRYFPLNTSGAFHSRWMQPVAKEFGEFLASVEFLPIKVPVISNYTARPYRQVEIAQNLTNQIVNPVRWIDSIGYLLSRGPMEFEELGNGTAVLDRLVAKIRKERPQTELPSSAFQERQDDPGTPLRGNTSSAADKVEQWNRRYAVGTKVKSRMIEQDGLETRTPAIVLFGCRAAVYLKGFNGYFDLDELAPVSD